MTTKAVSLLVLLTVWRIGTAVNWHSKTFIDRLSNARESDYQVPVDVCVRVSGGVEGMYCAFKSISGRFRLEALAKIQEVLPSPHSELVAGMVLGENQFARIPRYNDILKTVGLVHVVVVSGYNISLVFSSLMRILGSPHKPRNLVIGVFCTFIYSGISGFGIPAIRAWIMGSIAVLFKFYGRPARGLKVLIVSALVILCMAPSQLFSVSFQLSFLATLGIMVVPEALNGLWSVAGVRSKAALFEDFTTSLSAQLMVNPIISYYFGAVSLVALVANPLVLWVVPLCTVLGGLLVLSVFVSSLFAQILAAIMFPFLDVFVTFSEVVSGFSFSSVQLRFSFTGILVYYSTLVLGLRFLRRRA